MPTAEWVLLTGARQVGKSTLVKNLLAGRIAENTARYVTLDDTLSRSAADSDPVGFCATGPDLLAIDEIQLAPNLLTAIKMAVDEAGTDRRYLLTGSADIFTLPKVRESLAGRMEIQRLWPLTQAEIEGSKRNLVDELFGDHYIRQTPSQTGRSLVERIEIGGYPEVVGRPSKSRRHAWFESYRTTLIQRDLREISAIENVGDVSRLLGMVATRTATLVNYSEYSRTLAIPASTMKRYLGLLSTLYLTTTIRPWSANLSKRFVRSPKIYVVDSGLAADLAGYDLARSGSRERGQLIESFVAMELLRHADVTDIPCELYHYRTHDGEEIDFVLEDRQGNVVAIEVKGSRTVHPGDLKHLRRLQEDLGPRFRRGVILYEGEDVKPISDRLTVVPFSWIWG